MSRRSSTVKDCLSECTDSHRRLYQSLLELALDFNEIKSLDIRINTLGYNQFRITDATKQSNLNDLIAWDCVCSETLRRVVTKYRSYGDTPPPARLHCCLQQILL